MGKRIFVPSITHTGTWFVLRFLQHFISNLVEGKDFDERKFDVPEDCIVHFHYPITDKRDFSKAIGITGAKILASLFPTVIPIRDPLAALLSRETRQPQLRHFYIIHGYIHMQRTLFEHPNVIFLPIDLYETAEERFALLERVLKHCGIDSTPHTELLLGIAKEWKVENANPQNRFKTMYAEKDIDQISFLLGPKTAEVEFLKNQREIIFTQFLQKLGYKKENLLW